MSASRCTIVAAFLVAPWRASAQSLPHTPQVPPWEAGATIANVTVETFGAVRPDAALRYLSLRKGSSLEQAGVNRDYANLVELGKFRANLLIEPDATAKSVTLRWLVRARPLRFDAASFPVQGAGFTLTLPAVDDRGTNFSAYGQLGGLMDLARLGMTLPLHVDAPAGRASDFIADAFGARNTYRASAPLATNVDSWTAGTEARYLERETNGTQYEFAVRQQRSTDAQPSGIVAPSLYSTYKAPARNTLLEAGLAHACAGAATQLLYPPYCYLQYRFAILDGVGGLGATSEYQVYNADIAGYVTVGPSTLALHAATARTGGVLPDSLLVCGDARAYPKAFCGTDAQTLTAEYRIDDELPKILKLDVFTETTANRVRGGDQPWALPAFQWHADSGIGIVYRGIARLDLAYGSQGARLSFALKGESY